MLKYIKLHLLFWLLVCSAVFSKIASQYNFLSFYFSFFYGCSIFTLFIYAFFWQKMLIFFELSTAYLNRSVIIIWMIFIGAIFWNEPLSLNKLIAAVFIIIGVYFISSKGGDNV